MNLHDKRVISSIWWLSEKLKYNDKCWKKTQLHRWYFEQFNSVYCHFANPWLILWLLSGFWLHLVFPYWLLKSSKCTTAVMGIHVKTQVFLGRSARVWQVTGVKPVCSLQRYFTNVTLVQAAKGDSGPESHLRAVQNDS